jgi:hypothetical protein
MIEREVERMIQNGKRGHIAYTEEELLLGLTMMEKLEKLTDMMRYFLEHKNIKFTYLMMHVEDPDFESFINKQKRATDVLVPIEPEKGLYVIVCQETNIEGGYRFAERIIRELEVIREKRCISCNVLTVSTAHYTTQQVILYLLERYVDEGQKTAKSANRIDFHSIA